MAITPLMPVYPRSPVRPVRGEGVYLYGEGGEKYLDFASGIAVNLLGHGHPHLTRAIQEQAATLIHVSNLYGSPQGEALRAAAGRPHLRRHRLLHQFGRRGGRMRDQDRAPLPPSSRPAREARADHLHQRLPRPHARRRSAPPTSPRCATASRLCCPASPSSSSTISTRPRRRWAPHTAGFLVEPVQGEGGIRPASPEFMQRPARALPTRTI